MALLFRGMTECKICKKVITESQEARCFPAFISNEYDPLFIFNDASVHSECFENHELAKLMEDRLREFKNKLGVGNRYCTICNEEIKNPDEYICLGHFTDKKDDPLHKFNYLQFHEECLHDWVGREEFCTIVMEQLDRNKLKGKGFKRLIDLLRSK